MKKTWLQYLSYAGSLGLQILHPDLFALFCTPLPVGDSIDRRGGLELPLNSPILPPVERIK
jgi:hypothetical protein